ncbi:MAG: DUF4835 family protein [Candidatus Delongbacteria bacterium]|jgi:hypothetical protein|nr:DUF4835 family protein [Candidatus Delongbacteria bacterium]
MIKKAVIILMIYLLPGLYLQAQELDCRVQISYSQIQETSNRKMFQEMQSAVYEFMNNTVWTNHVFQRDERIECNMRIELKEKVSADEFKGSIQVQSSRTVYNSSYKSPVFKHIDKDFRIRYVEYEPLEFSINTHQSNFTSILAFYAYIMIGMDYDTFGMTSGDPFFQKAEQIVQNAQNAQEIGWKAYEDTKNRYWLVHDMLHDTYSPLREAMYIYHRQGLDRMYEKPVEGRARVEDAIMELKDVHNKRPGSFLMSIFVDTKSDEIVDIFSEAFPDQKNRVVQVMEEIDPANASKYQKILKEE